MPSAIAAATLADLSAIGRHDLPTYSRALVSAFDRYPPPFGMKVYGDAFRDLACNPEWLARSLIGNAAQEGEGASRLWDLAASTRESRTASQLKQHAIDESRHARMYVAIVDIVFRNAIGEDLRPLVQSLSPAYASNLMPVATPGSQFAHDLTLDDLIQMNIAEIRTRVHQLLHGPVLMVLCKGDRRHRLPPLLNALACDELNHVSYTALLIEEHARSGRANEVMELMEARVNDFNGVTRAELGDEVFSLGG